MDIASDDGDDEEGGDLAWVGEEDNTAGSEADRWRRRLGEAPGAASPSPGMTNSERGAEEGDESSADAFEDIVRLWGKN